MKRLIIAPHPDDELIGTGGLLLKAKNNKDNVKVVYVTTGATIKESKRKAMLREKAVKIVGKSLGLNGKQVFLRFPERSLFNVKNAKACMDRLKKVISSYRPDEIYVTAFEGGHPDHDIINFLISRIKPKARIIEYQMYNNYFTIKKVCQIFIREFIKKFTKRYFYWDAMQFIPKETMPYRIEISKEEIKQKNDNFRQYQLIAEKPLGCNPRILLTPYKADLFREMPKHNYLKSPHAGFPLPLNYEVAFGISFEDFRKLVLSLK